MILIIILVIVVAIIYFVWHDETMKNRISNASRSNPCVQALIELNQKYKFKNFDNKPRYLRVCKKKTQFDNFNIDAHLLSTIEDSPEYFEKLVSLINSNRKKYMQYEKEYYALLSSYSNNLDYFKLATQVKLSIEKYRQIEAQKCNDLKIKAILDFKIELVVNYTSPQGNNSYSKSYYFTYDDVIYYLKQYEKIMQNKEGAAYERSLLTPKLRYQILVRDNYTCQICNATAADGAKLHVDHIKPVSKGGKTVPENLRVLCEQCNLGKGNLYNPYGLN